MPIGAMLRAMTPLEEILATIRQLPLPERLRLIERASIEAAEHTPKPAAVAVRGRALTVDEFLAARLTLPAGVGPVSLQDTPVARGLPASCSSRFPGCCGSPMNSTEQRSASAPLKRPPCRIEAEYP